MYLVHIYLVSNEYLCWLNADANFEIQVSSKLMYQKKKIFENATV